MKSNEDKLKRFTDLCEELGSLYQEIFEDIAKDIEQYEYSIGRLKETCYDLSVKNKKLEKTLNILKPRINLKESTIINDGKEYEVLFIDASGFVFKDSEEHRTLGEWLDDK